MRETGVEDETGSKARHQSSVNCLRWIGRPEVDLHKSRQNKSLALGPGPGSCHTETNLRASSEDFPQTEGSARFGKADSRRNLKGLESCMLRTQ